MEERFDVIIVGGGLAGITAAYRLASAEVRVMLIERGEHCGEKNMTGGRLYGHSLSKLIPDFAKRAPIERRVVKERVSFITHDSATTIEYADNKLGYGSPSYTVMRADFDKWLATEAEKKGAFCITGIRVDDLLVKEGKVCGVIAGDDRAEADLVILADGANSLLAQKIGFSNANNPKEMAVGVKDVIKLGEDKINERFGLKNGEGVSWLFAGAASGHHPGGGFIYTNKDSIAVGIVITLSEIETIGTSVPEMLEAFKKHSAVAPLIEGGELVEYSAHLVPEGGYGAVSKLYGNGVLVVGDAAGLVMNLGYMVRGMDLAIESGRLAAETYIELKKTNSFEASNLSLYERKLKNSFVFKEMKQHRFAPEAFSSPNVFTKLPALAESVMQKLFVVDGKDSRGFIAKAILSVNEYGFTKLVKDVLKLIRAV